MNEEQNTEQKQIEVAKLDPQQFEPLYLKYYSRILGFVYKRMDNIDEAREITSTVFTKALINIGKYVEKGHPFSSWLHRIAINEVNQFYRNSSKNRVISLDDIGVSRLAEQSGNAIENLSPILSKAMAYLNEDEVLLLELRFFEDKAFAEVGAILDITENNAKVKTYRVLDKLREVFNKLNH